MIKKKKIFDNNNNPLKNKEKIKKIIIKFFKKTQNKNHLCLVIVKILNIKKYMKKIIFTKT